MPKIGVVHEIMSFIIEKDGSLGNEYMATEHDVIYLPVPRNCTEEEIQEKAEKWGVSIEDDYFTIFV